MRTLKQLNTKDLVFFDIETVRLVEELKQDTPLWDSWEYKKKRDGLDISELPASYNKEAALYPEFAKIICISVGRIVGEKLQTKSYYGSDEYELLNSFNEDLKVVYSSNPKTKLVGFASKGFDQPFIFKRMIINGIAPADGLDVSGLKPWEISDIDLKDEWRGPSYDSASLINIATALGLPSPKDDISGADVGKVFYEEGAEGLKRIERYCRKDVVTTANIFRKCRFESVLEEEEQSSLSIEKTPAFLSLYEGAEYVGKVKLELEEAVLTLIGGEKEIARDMLNRVAAKRNTKIKKADVNKLFNE